MVCIDADTKTLPKGNDAPQQQQQPCKTEQHSSPGDYLGVEEFLLVDGGPIERGGQHHIEIKYGERWNEEIGFVYIAEFHCLYALLPQEKNAGQYDSKHENEC